MSALERVNPIVTSIYFICVSLTVMLHADPCLAVTAAVGALLTFGAVCRGRERAASRHLTALALFAVTALANPLLSHRGSTVLLVVNDMPITLEATLYGVVAAGGLAAVLYLFYSFSHIMTSDRLLYILSAISPRAALVLSMTLRCVPMMSRQRRRIIDAQRVLGTYSEDSLAASIKASVSSSGALLTWSLENGIITADSMAARGYGSGRRTRLAPYSFTVRDALLLALMLALTLICILGTSGVGFVFYPKISVPPMTARRAAGYAAYALLAVLPVLLELKEMLKWKYYESKM